MLRENEFQQQIEFEKMMLTKYRGQFRQDNCRRGIFATLKLAVISWEAPDGPVISWWTLDGCCYFLVGSGSTCISIRSEGVGHTPQKIRHREGPSPLF